MREMIAPVDRRGNRLREGVDVREAICRRIAHDVRRLFAALKLLHRADEIFPYGDHRFVTYSQVFARSVIDRPHGFGRAAVVIEKVFDTGVIFGRLNLAILQIVIRLVDFCSRESRSRLLVVQMSASRVCSIVWSLAIAPS